MFINKNNLENLLLKRKIRDRIFMGLCIFSIVFALTTLVVFLIDIFSAGFDRIDWKFLTSFPSRKPEEAGIYSALAGTFYLIVLTSLISFPVGVCSAIYLEEYAPKNRFTKFIEINIANLAGVPSIIYGILGLGLFVRALDLKRSLIAGALTMSLLVLPIIIIAAREALRAVPESIRHASFALGATKWQTIWHQVLPLSIPGILTGTILAISRAIGETAPLIAMGALTYIAFTPDSIFAPFTVLPIQIFNWVSRPQHAFAINAAAGIVTLLVVLLTLNAFAIWLRNHYQRGKRW